jgi:hypothetical protein
VVLRNLTGGDAMIKTVAIRLLEDGSLLSLRALIGKLSLPPVQKWVLRDMELHPLGPHTQFLGHSIPEFEAMTETASGARIVVTPEQFADFLALDIQVLNGCIDGVRDADPGPDVVLSICCHDSTEWEISTNSQAVLDTIRSAGLLSD